MVNNLIPPDPRILVEGRFNLRAGSDGRTKIVNGPVYDLEIAKRLAAQYRFVPINSNSESAKKRELVPKLGDDEVAAILAALDQQKHYQGSEKQCASTANMKVDSDEYLIWWHRNRRQEDTSRMFGIPIYVKFGFKYPIPKCLIVSIHRSDRH